MALTDGGRSDWQRSGRTWLGVLGAVVVAASLGWAVGPPGLLVGAVIAGLWYLLSGAYTVAIGHVLAVPVLPEPSLGILIALEVGFVAVIAAPVVLDRAWPAGLAAVSASALVFGAIAWLGWQAWEPRWLAALALVGLGAVGLYGLHRYSLVTLEVQGVEPLT